MNEIIPIEDIAQKICFVRGRKTILDKDLAELYDVETRALNQAVKRQIKRFPDDFMFRLTKAEYDSLISQNVISKNPGRGGLRKLPFAFTEQGIAMLSGVLNSDRAIQVNIRIMRTFIRLRHLVSISEELKRELSDLREQTDQRFNIVFEALDQILQVEGSPGKKIGFTVKEKLEEYGKKRNAP